MSTSRPTWILAALSVLTLLGPSISFSQDAGAPRQAYTINPGDVLEISVWKEPDLQRSVLVRPDGEFSFPLAGEILAVGRTVSDVSEEIRSRLEEYIPGLVVTVAVSEIGGNKIFVIGQVNRPGEFIVNPRVDVMQALSIAGGATPFAQLNDIKILRRTARGQIVLRFRYSDVAKGQNLEQNVMLEVGDVVVVP